MLTIRNIDRIVGCDIPNTTLVIASAYVSTDNPTEYILQFRDERDTTKWGFILINRIKDKEYTDHRSDALYAVSVNGKQTEYMFEYRFHTMGEFLKRLSFEFRDYFLNNY